MPILITWMPNNEKKNIFKPKRFFAKIRNSYSVIIWKINNINDPNIMNNLFKFKENKIKTRNNNVIKQEKAWLEVAKEPRGSNFFFTNKIWIYFSVLSIILLNREYKLTKKAL